MQRIHRLRERRIILLIVEEREELWWEMDGIRGVCEGTWMICGNFNITRYVTEKKNSRGVSRAMR